MWPFSRLRYRYHRLSDHSKLEAHIRNRPTLSIIVAFFALYVLLVLAVRLVSRRDPTSIFFDPDLGFEPQYSSIRREQADTFIEGGYTLYGSPVKWDSTQKDQSLCVGIATVARDDVRYFRSTVGAVLEGLHPMERQRIHLILFIAHTDPWVHPAYSESWTHDLADQILLYNGSSEEMSHLKWLETDRALMREKALFDYTYLLKACSAVGVPYIAMLEDDVIAMDGWFQRTRNAIGQVRDGMAAKYNGNDFLYLRMFYTEEFLGWNSEEWPKYTIWSISILLFVTTILFAVRYCSGSARTYIDNKTILIICGVCVPLCIMLFFAAGRVTVLPFRQGVHEMNSFGCCSQGFIFSTSKAQDLIKWYEEKKVGFIDMLTEEYAEIHGEKRWAITPSVIQHTGKKSSKGDDVGSAAKYDRSVAEKIWSFAFELFNADALRREHARGMSQDFQVM